MGQIGEKISPELELQIIEERLMDPSLSTAKMIKRFNLKCSRAKQDFRLFFLIPIIILAWHWAWVVHFPKGMLARNRILSGDVEFNKRFTRMY